jgi:hypothetical protein
MSTVAPLQAAAAKSAPPAQAPSKGVFRRKCGCSAMTTAHGVCAECAPSAPPTGLVIGASGDPLEREADRIADEVLAPPTNTAVRSAVPGIRRAGVQPVHTSAIAPASVGRALADPGASLAPGLRQEMEQRFGHDFSKVRVHLDAGAAQSASEVQARAYTAGHDVVFAEGRFAPATEAGRRLIAHELTHVLQQSGNGTVRAIQRADDPAAPAATPGVPSAVPPSAPRVDAPATKSEICPSCICTPDHITRLDVARGRASSVFGRAAAQLRTTEPDVGRLFEASFGPGSADAGTMSKTAALFDGAKQFLDESKVSTPEADGNIHCDQANDTDGCAGGATGFYRSGNVVVCGGHPSAAQMLDPPEVEKQVKIVETSGGVGKSQEWHQEPDPEATEALQKQSDAAFAARLTALVAHEAVHHVVQPSVVDVYRDERLFRFLGQSAEASGVDLAPLALQNPDSLVRFAFKGLNVGRAVSDPLSETEAAISGSEALSGKMSIRPVLGRRRARVTVSLAEEAIGQAAESLAVLLSYLQSVATGGSAWTLFPDHLQSVVQLLIDVGQETAFAQPDAAAAARLQEISGAFQRLVKSMRSRKLVVGRRFLRDKPDQRIEIAIPDWKAFRSMAPIDQLTLLLDTLLKEEPVIGGLPGFVLEHAKTWGGMQALAPDEGDTEEGA